MPLPALAQQRLWLLDSFSPELPLHNDACVVHLRGELDRGALSVALNEIGRNRSPAPSESAGSAGFQPARGRSPRMDASRLKG
ncbi:MAG: hypothetical protein GY856_16810, partial [bacterium]|nr:hypothetical protein [bacterium]